MPAKKHVHAWRIYATTGPPFKPFTCIDQCECGEERKRPPTKQEIAERKESDRLSRAIHHVYHKVHNALGTKIGWEAMEAMRKLAKKPAFRDHVRVVGVDDNHHASSSLVLVDHRNEREYWGTTVIFIPQCTGEKPTSFFLYPNHAASLFEALARIPTLAENEGLKYR